MSTTLGSPSPEHQRLVQALVTYLNNNGWTISHTDGVGPYPRPFEVDGRIPDVIARNATGLLALGEAETCDFLDNEQTIDQINVFSNRQMRDGGQTIPFFILVPETCRVELANLIQRRFSSRTNITQLYLPSR